MFRRWMSNRSLSGALGALFPEMAFSSKGGGGGGARFSPVLCNSESLSLPRYVASTAKHSFGFWFSFEV